MKHSVPLPEIDAIRAASREIVRHLGFMRADLAGTGLPPSAVHAVLEVGVERAKTARDLADLLGLEKSSVSRMLAKMNAKGLIETTPNPQDQRQKRLRLTPEGRALFDQIETFARGQVGQALRGMSRPEREQIRAGLTHYAQALVPSTQTPPAETPLSSAATSSQPTTPTYGSGYRPTLLARITQMHAQYYSRAFGFGAQFECLVAAEVAAFLSRPETPESVIFHASLNDEIIGSITIDGASSAANHPAERDKTADLRWFILADAARGLGIGQELLARAMAHVDQQGISKTQLWTFEGLDAARHLYEKHGFTLISQSSGTRWGPDVQMQMFERQAPSKQTPSI